MKISVINFELVFLKKIPTNGLFFGKTQLLGIPFFIFFLFLGIISKAQQEIRPCNQPPSFIQTLGFDPLWTALSTSEKQKMGVVLIVYKKAEGISSPLPNGPRETVYQDPSWRTGGYLSAICFDKFGNAYLIPSPFISMLYNPIDKLNTVYQIDHNTGGMQPWLAIQPAKKTSKGNPYGLLGIAYDCLSNHLYCTTVAPSDRNKEAGIIYMINANTKRKSDSLVGIDAMGLTVALDELGNKRLYFGKTRTGEIFSIAVNAKNKFVRSSLRKELSLEGMGPRGDDKARKIRFQNNTMIVNGIAFNYNLQASSEKPETQYKFQWNYASKKWQLIDLQ